MGAETKKCPNCAEEIQANARICHFCQAELEAVKSGYCSKCREVVDIGARDACPNCGGGVIDVILRTRVKTPALAAVSVPAGPPMPAAAAPQVVPTMVVAQGRMREGIVGSVRHLVGFVLLVLGAVFGFIFSLLSFMSRWNSGNTMLPWATEKGAYDYITVATAPLLMVILSFALIWAMPRVLSPNLPGGIHTRFNKAVKDATAKFKESRGNMVSIGFSSPTCGA